MTVAARTGGRCCSPKPCAAQPGDSSRRSNVGVIRSVIPALSRDVEWFPGLPKSWAMTFLVNDAPAPTGRASGSLSWAGLANVYYWIDRSTGLAGVWMTQIFPFGDPASMRGYLEFETAAYASR